MSRWHTQERGFTLVEMLTVLGLIVLILAILLPVTQSALRAAEKTECLIRVKSLGDTHLAMAVDNDNFFPDLSNHDGYFGGSNAGWPAPYWINNEAREAMISDYGLNREYVYCPSNEKWNTDENWERGSANQSVWGYQGLAGRSRISTGNTTSGTWRNISGNQQTVLLSVEDNPVFDILWVDLSRTDPDGDFGNGANHFLGAESVSPTLIDGGKGLGGANVGFLDGSAEWRRKNTLELRFTQSNDFSCWW